MKWSERFSIVLATLLVMVLIAASGAGEIFVDPGACPGEGCVYGETWTVREPIELRAAPEEVAPVVSTLSPPAQVETRTGEVHTRPGLFVVTKPRGTFVTGDELLLYTYLGEGWYRVRHAGELQKADLGFGPRGKRCRAEDDRGCWGVLKRPVESRWWVQLRTSSGLEGWVVDSRSLEKPGAH